MAMPTSCLSYRSGEVIRYIPRDAEARTPVGVQLVDVTPANEAGAIEKYACMPGTELSALEAMSSHGVIVSLNYVCGSASGKNAAFDSQPSDELQWYLLSPVAPNAEVQGIRFEDIPPGDCVIAVDVNPAHCREVMMSIADGYTKYATSRPLAIVGVSPASDGVQFSDLFAYARGLHALGSVTAGIVAINLSVDVGAVCLKDEVGSDVEASLGPLSYSFPFFEAVLRAVCRRIEARAQNGKTVPAVFAAAGNRTGHGKGQRRLAYPASLHDVIAVTFVQSTSPDVQANSAPRGRRRQRPIAMHECADAPAISDLKPAFSLLVEQATDYPTTNGTSFACSWLAGWYAAAAIDPQTGMPLDATLRKASVFGKLAWLNAHSDIAHASNGDVEQPALSSPDLLTTRLLHARGAVKHSPTSRTTAMSPEIQAVMTRHGGCGTRIAESAFRNVDLGINAMVKGPLAMLLTASVIQRAKLQLAASVTTGIDLEVQGWGPLSASTRAAIDDWYEVLAATTLPLPTPPAVLYCDLWSPTSPERAFGAIVPATRIAVGPQGMVDAWGGVEDLRNGALRLILPPADAGFSMLSPGFADGIVEWLTAILRLQSCSGRQSDCTFVPDPASMGKVKEALAAPSTRLFGWDARKGAERVTRKLTLMREVAAQVGTAADWTNEIAQPIETAAHRILEPAAVATSASCEMSA
jgi:hypothetical protein